MGEKIKPLSKKDIPIPIVIAGAVAGMFAIKEVFDYLKAKADEKKRADLERLEKDVTALRGPAVLEEAGRELADGQVHKEINELANKKPEGAVKDAMQALATMSAPAPKRKGKSR